MIKRLAKYGYNVLVALDQFINTIFAGYPDETLSARSWRKAQAGQWFWRAMRWGVDMIFFWEPGHCKAAFENEAARGHSPRELAAETEGNAHG